MISNFAVKFRQIFLLTEKQMLGSVLIALAIFLVEFAPHFIQAIEKGSKVAAGETGKSVSQYVIYFWQYLSEQPYANIVINGIIWAFIGIVVYSAVVAVNNIVVDIKNEIIVDSQYAGDSLAKVLAGRFAGKILAALGFVALVALSVFISVPFLMDLLKSFVQSGMALTRAHELIIGLVGLGLNIYIVWAAAHFTWIYEESV